jgi:hypothetical protein
MNVKSILGTIGKTALPALAAAVIPGGPLLGIAAKFISDKLGGAPIQPTPEAIDKAINDAHATDPEALLKLQDSDHAFAEYMAKLGVDSVAKIEELSNQDRASARAREIAVKDKIPAILSVGVTVGFFGCLIMLAFAQVQPAAHDLLLTMTGSLGTAWIGIINYYFGSSSGSAAKTDILAKQVQSK